MVITPSHNPPEDGGFKYNPPHGGPAAMKSPNALPGEPTRFWKTSRNQIKRIPFEKALKANTTHEYDYIRPYVDDLANVIDMEILGTSGLKLGVDPMGGAAVHYWEPIAEHYGLSLEIVNPMWTLPSVL